MNETFVKTDTGNYVRIGAYRGIYAAQSGTDWVIWMDLNDGSGSVSLSGAYPSEAEAQEVIRRFTNGVTLSSLD